MKTIYKRIFPLLTLFILYACAGEEGSNEVMSRDYLKCTKQIALSGDGSQSGTLEIVADCQWTIAGFPAWLSFSQNSGTGNATVQVTSTPNPSAADERRVTFTVNNGKGNIKQQVDVVQAVATESITLNVTELIFEKSAGSKTLSISSNTSWQILGVEDWFSVSQSSGSGNADVLIEVLENPSENDRTATLTIKGSQATATVSLNQAAGGLPVMSPVTVSDVSVNDFTVESGYISANTVTECGFCYGMTKNPTKENGTAVVCKASDGKFKTTISGLNQSTTYHVRAYAITSVGIAYSEDMEVTTIEDTPQDGDIVTPPVP